MKKQRILALILALVMVVCALPLSIFANGESTPEAQTEEALTLTGVSVSLGGKIGLNFYVEASDDVLETATAKISFDGKVTEKKLSEAEKTENGIRFSALLSSIELSETVTLSFVDEGGNTLTFATAANGAVTEYSTSVAEYAKTIVENESYDAKAKAAVKALMAFGAYAEKYFKGTDVSASDVLTETELANIAAAAFGTVIKADGTTETLIDETLNTIITATGDTSGLGSAYLVLDSYNKIRIEYTSETAPVVTSTDAVVQISSRGEGVYWVDITGIQARNLNTVYTVNIGDATVSISLLAVAKLVADDPEFYGADFANLAKALYNYYHYTHGYEMPNYIFCENFSDAAIDFDTSKGAGKSNGITFAFNNPNAGSASFKTYKDETTGKSYLLVKDEEKTSVQTILKIEPSASVPSIASIASNQISFEISLGTDGANEFLGLENISIGNFYLLKIWRDSEVSYMNGQTTYGGATKLTNVDKSGNGAITTIRVAIDFAENTVKFYDGNGGVMLERALPVESGLDLKASMTSSLLDIRTTQDAWFGSTRIYGIKIAEGNIYEKSNSIVYNVGDGTLPENAPKTYSDYSDTVLPIPTHPTYEFAGWFTTPDFNPETKITSISPSTRGKVTVYAKWVKNVVKEYIINEDFSELDVDISSGNVTKNNITFAFNNSGTASFKTYKDEATGESYLLMTRTSNGIQPILKVNTGESIPTVASMESNQVSFEISLGYNGGSMLGLEQISIGGFNLFKIYGSDGSTRYYSSNGGSYQDDVVPRIDRSESGAVTTIRLTIDFEEKTVKFYDGNGNVISECAHSVEKASMTSALLDIRTVSSNWHGSIRIYGIKIAEGSMFE